MRISVVLRYVGLTLLVIAFFMLLSFGVSLYYRDQGALPLLFGALITALLGVFPAVFVPSVSRISNREGYAIVVLSWLAVCFFGMIPYILYGGEFGFSGAWFESVSGFSTTGATILNDIEALPSGLLFWRSLTHWIGGMGVVVFALVVLPGLGKAQMTLSRMEVSAIARQDFRYRSKTMLRVMASIYLGLTFLTVFLLWAVDVPLFDALNIGFSAVATGGFALKNYSLLAYSNAAAELILIGVMLLSSVHFGLLFGLVLGRVKAFYRSPILRYFLLFVTVATLVVAINCHGSVFPTWGESFRHAAFQVVSVVSTTGFASADFSLWPSFSILFLLLLSAVGGCSGSTAGGVKVDRIAILTSSLRTMIHRLQHPNAVVAVRVGKVHLDMQEVNTVLLYILAFFSTVLLATVIFTLGGLDVITSFCSSLSCMSNVGPALGAMGSFDSFAFMPAYGRVILSLLMLLGRLEIYGLLLVFFPSSWK